MRNFSLFIFFICLIPFCIQCNRGEKAIHFTVKNDLGFTRNAEIISISTNEISHRTNCLKYEDLCIRDEKTDSCLLTQLIDTNSDSKMDVLLFQIDIRVNEEKKFSLTFNKNTVSKTNPSGLTTFARFVPERIDDFAWENDRVAFRIYGPEAQKLTEAGSPNGTLSSGIDCWLKKVHYPIIDKWYKLNLDIPGYYHINHGEGYDPYHVGKSLGCGGFGVLINDSLYTSKNFTSYKVIANGPITSIFEVDYAPWNAGNQLIRLKKRIRIDMGSFLSKIEIQFKNDSVPNGVVGLTLHNSGGTTCLLDSKNGCSYWQNIGQIGLGTGMIIAPENVSGFITHMVKNPDASHLFAKVKPVNKTIVYYAGYGWEAAGYFKNQQQWNQYLNEFSERIKNPLIIHFN